MSESSIFAENQVMRDQVSQEGLLMCMRARLPGAPSEDSLPSLEGWSETALGSLGKGKWAAGTHPQPSLYSSQTSLVKLFTGPKGEEIFFLCFIDLLDSWKADAGNTILLPANTAG